MHGFIAFWHGKRAEIHADTLLAARTQAARIFHAKRDHEITVMLAEKDGNQARGLCGQGSRRAHPRHSNANRARARPDYANRQIYRPLQRGIFAAV